MKGWYYEGWRHSLAAKGIKTALRNESFASKEVGEENVIGIAMPFPRKISPSEVGEEEKAWIDGTGDGKVSDVFVDGLKISSDAEAGSLNEGFKDLFAFGSGEFAANFIRKGRFRKGY